MSATSIGIFITKVCRKDIPSLYLVMMTAPLVLAFLNLISQNSSFASKKASQPSSGEIIVQAYEHICKEINLEMEKEWKLFNERL